MNPELEELRETHTRVMAQHVKSRRNQRYIFVGLVSFYLFVILYAAYSLITAEPVNVTAQQALDHVHFTIALYSALAVLLVGQAALALRSRAQIIQLFIDHLDTSYELGRLSARLEGQDADDAR